MAGRILEQLGARLRAGFFSFLELSPSEEREKRLRKQADDLRARLGRLLAERRLLEKEAEDAAHDADDLGGKAETAILLGRDDLARAAVRARVRRSARLETLEVKLAAAAHEAAALYEALRDLGADFDLSGQLAELDALARGARAEG